MEPNEIVERQKLVPDVETEEEPITAPQSAPKSVPTSPAVVVPKITYVNERRGVTEERFEFKSRPPRKLLKEVPDVKHMERALLGLLEDFHSGKLKAFGSGCTMEQMTKIREQQESLAKLHFELAASEEHSGSNDLSSAKAQENMLQLVQHLEQLSISIEQLQTSHNGL